MILSKEQIESYLENGFLVIEKFYSINDVLEIKALFKDLLDVSSRFSSTQVYKNSQFVIEGGLLQRVVWCQGVSPKLAKYSDRPELIATCKEILNTNSICQLISQAHIKIPGENLEFELHQDSQHRGYGSEDWNDLGDNGSYVQTVLALDQMTKDNGPLFFYKGSHKLGHLSLDKNPDIDLSKFEKVTPLLAPGDLALFGPFTIHGSSPNKSNEHRMVFINGFACKDANSREYPGCGKGILK